MKQVDLLVLASTFQEPFFIAGFCSYLMMNFNYESLLTKPALLRNDILQMALEVLPPPTAEYLN